MDSYTTSWELMSIFLEQQGGRESMKQEEGPLMPLKSLGTLQLLEDLR